MSNGAVDLGSIVGRVSMLEVSCKSCPRRGRLSVARLVAEYGADMSLLYLAHKLAGNCPKLQSPSVYDLCRVQFPEVSAMLVADYEAQKRRELTITEG